jgi:hypothetical protein
MVEDNQARSHSTEPAKGGARIPPPEQGSPMPADAEDHKDEDIATHEGASDANPLAPPITTDAGS